MIFFPLERSQQKQLKVCRNEFQIFIVFFFFSVPFQEYEQVNCDSIDDFDEEGNDDVFERDPLTEPSTSYNLTAVSLSDTMDAEKTTPNSILAYPTNNWDKFRLLMWKNFKLQWRHKIQMIVEIAVPVLFNALLVLIRSLVEPEVYPNPTHYQPFHINTLDPLR